jgi:hypothetical protein
VKIIEHGFKGEIEKGDGTTYKVIYFVMEIADNGELYNVLFKMKLFSESVARTFFL